jgi:glycosyltransferase involved in cell wall biosynthesis
MRILLVGDYPNNPRLGSSKVLLKLQEEFRSAGHVCDLLLADELGAFPRNGHARQLLEPVAALVAVRRAFRDRGPYDVVDVTSAEGLWLAALRRARLFGAAVVSRSNGLEHLNYRRMLDDADAGLWKKPLTRRWWYPMARLSQVAVAARLSDRLVLLNETDRDFALSRRWKPEDAIDLVAHGVSARFVDNPPARDRPRGRGILFCGTWDHVKGIRYLADAFARLVAEGRTTNLTVLGGGVPAETIREGFPADARRHLTVLERLPEPDVIGAYRDHDVLVMPSSYEGFGMVLLEAMTQRLPVVSTPVGCARTLVMHERTGLLVPSRDPVALAGAIGRMLDDQKLRGALAERAFASVRHMTWASTATAMLGVYQKALANRHG